MRFLGIPLLLCLGTITFTAPARGESATTSWRAPPTVTLTLDNPAPIIGISRDAELRIQVSEAPDIRLPLPRVQTSAGEIKDLIQTDHNSFRARFVLPESRYPQSAILMAEFPHPAAPLRGWLAVRLSAAAEPLFHTDPDAKVSLWVGDKEFGPQVAPANGAVRIPIVVPPGITHALARSTNHYGKTTEHRLDLRVPYSQQILLAPPPAVTAGGLVEVGVFAVDTRGEPAAAERISLEVIPPTLIRPLGGRIPGEARFLIQAPTLTAVQTIYLLSKLDNQNTTQVKSSMTIAPTTVAGLSLVAEQDQLDPSPGTPRRVFISANDGYGNPIDIETATVLVDGQPVKIQTSDRDIPFVLVQTPKDAQIKPHVVVEAVLGGFHRTLTLPVEQLAKPRTQTISEQSLHPRYTIMPRIGFVWNFGQAAGASFFVEGFQHRNHRGSGFGLGCSLGVLSTWFATQDEYGIAKTSLTTIPVLLLASQRYTRQRWFVSGTAGLGLALSYASTSTFKDYRLNGYAGGAATLLALETGVLLQHAHLVFSLRYLTVYLNTLSNDDRIRGNAGGAIADVGYRWVW